MIKDQSMNSIISVAWSWFSTLFPLLWAWTVYLLAAPLWSPCTPLFFFLQHQLTLFCHFTTRYRSKITIFVYVCAAGWFTVKCEHMDFILLFIVGTTALQSLTLCCCHVTAGRRVHRLLWETSLDRWNSNYIIFHLMLYKSSINKLQSFVHHDYTMWWWLDCWSILSLRREERSSSHHHLTAAGWTDRRMEVVFLCGLKQDFLQSVQ